jgi:hypothetical protein
MVSRFPDIVTNRSPFVAASFIEATSKSSCLYYTTRIDERRSDVASTKGEL